MCDPKISVIVPVYRVESYLPKCLDSIVCQTYQNLEIILVDDGSPDRCGSICDAYAVRDSRVRVIHQKNGGLSAARNAGLCAASGEYLGFVDSDDWIEADMYEYMLRNLRAEQADIAVCGHYDCSRGRLRPRGPDRREACGTAEALGHLLRDDKVQNFVWDKLYRRELFSGIRFPEGSVYEDFAIMDQIFIRAKRVVLLPEKKYYYLLRPDSIAGSASLAHQMDRYRMARRRCGSLSGEWPQYRDLLAGQCVASAIGIWSCYYRSPREERVKYREQIREAAAFSGENLKVARRHAALGRIGRVVIRLTPYDNCPAFATAWLLGLLYRFRHGRYL